jgi:alpha-galactosidase
VTLRPELVRHEVHGPETEGLVVDVESDGATTTWSIANVGDRPVAVDHVALVFALPEVRFPLRLFRNGYQSWSLTDAAAFGVDEDPSLADTLPFLRDMHHADREPADPGDLRSEQVTVLVDHDGPPTLVGFLGGRHHDGTIRVRGGPGRVEVRAEAILGGAVLEPGVRRTLHPVVIRSGEDTPTLLARWAGDVGAVESARVSAPYQVGWCSWYHYFDGVTEADIADNLARAGDWPFDVFQVDDGYQSAIGDWLVTNAKFPSGVDGVATSIAEAGYTPGIWLAPFIVSPGSQLAADHPEWLAREADDPTAPLIAMFNDIWGGFQNGLDVTRPEVLDHIAGTARDLVDAGYRYLKLDFTFSAKIRGGYADATLTPAERVRGAYEAVRRGAGDDVFILGCGAPLGSLVGVVDGMRIGPDVGPHWGTDHLTEPLPGYRETQPSTRGAWRSTLGRSFMHRRLWLNDPDCLMLRTSQTRLTPEQARTWALAVGVSGGMALVSDDLALLGPEERALLDEVIALGRAADAEAIAGSPPSVPDQLDGAIPTTLQAAGRTLVGDPEAGTATLS